MFKTALRPSSKRWRCALPTAESGKTGPAPLVLSTHSPAAKHSTRCHVDPLLSAVIHSASREEGTMRKELMLEALAAWLALAAASGQACASIQQTQTGANSVLSVVASPDAALDEVTTSYSGGKVPANGSVRASADVALLTSAATDRSGTRFGLTTGVHAPARGPFRIDVPQSNATSAFSPSSADDFTPGRKNGFDTELKRRAAVQPPPVGGAAPAPGGPRAANRGGGPNPGENYLFAQAQPPPRPPAPPPPPRPPAPPLAGAAAGSPPPP